MLRSICAGGTENKVATLAVVQKEESLATDKEAVQRLENAISALRKVSPLPSDGKGEDAIGPSQHAPDLDYKSEVRRMAQYTNRERYNLTQNVKMQLNEIETELIRKVYSRDIKLAAYAAFMLGQLDSKSSVKCLADRITIKDNRMAEMPMWVWDEMPATEALQHIGIRSVSPLVHRLSTTDVEEVRQQCIEALGNLAADTPYGATVTTAMLQDALSKTTDPREISNLRAAETFVQQRIAEHQKSMAKARRSGNGVDQ